MTVTRRDAAQAGGGGRGRSRSCRASAPSRPRQAPRRAPRPAASSRAAEMALLDELTETDHSRRRALGRRARGRRRRPTSTAGSPSTIPRSPMLKRGQRALEGGPGGRGRAGPRDLGQDVPGGLARGAHRPARAHRQAAHGDGGPDGGAGGTAPARGREAGDGGPALLRGAEVTGRRAATTPRTSASTTRWSTRATARSSSSAASTSRPCPPSARPKTDRDRRADDAPA